MPGLVPLVVPWAVTGAALSWAASLGTGAALVPNALFAGFPAVSFGLPFAAARLAIERNGARPASFGADTIELAWDGRFAGHDGRATLLFAPGYGLRPISLLLQAPRGGDRWFERFGAQIAARQGAADQRILSSLDRTLTWPARAGVVVSLRQTLPAPQTLVLSWISP
ncbi:hypothetical protein [Cyanobium sp. Morenito 9A2]|uniref:hypothetical protein n=1 Tax=Cyanobium sp. Morenito 9A2 TaxID=2823718 RepID=UPI0020CBD9DC|nr:hypothetical protein [Cyanobium sp. Morenito 9A2]MCP9848610.1 hypothetical protein [Cyanobium sp. Morenito 9A2]